MRHRYEMHAAYIRSSESIPISALFRRGPIIYTTASVPRSTDRYRSTQQKERSIAAFGKSIEHAITGVLLSSPSLADIPSLS